MAVPWLFRRLGRNVATTSVEIGKMKTASFRMPGAWTDQIILSASYCALPGDLGLFEINIAAVKELAAASPDETHKTK